MKNDIVNIIFTVLLTGVSVLICFIDKAPKWLFVVIALICIAFVWIAAISKIILRKQFDDKTEKLKLQFAKETEMLKNQLNEKSEKLKSILNEISIDVDTDNAGNRLFLMSLTQDIAEPLRIEYLKTALNEYNNVLAGLLLGNIYSNMVERNGEIVFKADWDKAAEVYEKLKDYDHYGVSQWMLGWCYQNRFTKAAQKMKPEESMSKALELYQESEKCNFPKAYNSIANLMQIDVVPDGDDNQMIHYYETASDLNDIYGTINSGIVYFKKYKTTKTQKDFDRTKRYFLKAIKYESPNSYLYLSQLYIEHFNNTNNQEILEKAIPLLLKLIKYGANQLTAAAYVILGQQIKDHRFLINDEIRNLFPEKNDSELPLEFVLKAKSVFEYLEVSGKMISEENRKYYDYIKDLI